VSNGDGTFTTHDIYEATMAALGRGSLQPEPVYALDEDGEIHRITRLTWSEDNQCWWLHIENDVEAPNRTAVRALTAERFGPIGRR
jgi:hypothetical protein